MSAKQAQQLKPPRQGSISAAAATQNARQQNAQLQLQQLLRQVGQQPPPWQEHLSSLPLPAAAAAAAVAAAAAAPARHGSLRDQQQ